MKKAMAPGLIALVMATLFFFTLKSREEQFTKNYGESVNVLVAKYDIPERTYFKPEMAQPTPIPRKFVLQDAIEIKSVTDFGKLRDLVTLVRVPKGNQLTYSQLTRVSPDTGLAVKIPPGLRAAVVPVPKDLITLVKPGDRVDVLCTFPVASPDGGGSEWVTATILQNILVLSVGSEMGGVLPPEEMKKKEKTAKEKLAVSDEGFVSVAVSALEAQFLTLGKKQGEISVVLRPLGDIEKHFIEMASFRKLFR
ncbi:MAG: Flp pilus assembly protein CpaB [Elusimicrobia bacterium]|nr:Flp pilus assembly protein CpaB [Elusimicrobiota bacterium]